jgi:hypothetical protein
MSLPRIAAALERIADSLDALVIDNRVAGAERRIRDWEDTRTFERQHQESIAAMSADQPTMEWPDVG